MRYSFTHAFPWLSIHHCERLQSQLLFKTLSSIRHVLELAHRRSSRPYVWLETRARAAKKSLSSSLQMSTISSQRPEATTTMGLPCAHVMERRMNEGDQVLKLTDIHSHWHLKREEISENHDESDEAAAELLRVNEPAVAKPAGRPPGAKGKKRTRQQAFDESTRREPSGFEYAAADALARQQGLTASPGVAARGGRGRGVPRGSRAPDGGSTRGGGRARNGGSTRGGGRARDGGSAGITRGGDRPIPAAGYRSKDTETEQSTNGSDHDDSDQDSITSSIAAKWALSDDPQLDERMWRVKSGDDFGGRLQQYVDNHRRKVERDPEAARAEAQSWRKHWAKQVGCQPNGRLTRKEYHYATGEDDIPRPPRYDDLNPIFKAPDMSRSMGERLHSWAVCDPDKKDDLNPLRHSPERVLGYWKKYDAEGRMPTNPLATPQASAVAIAQAAVAMVQDPVPAVTRPLAKRPKRPTRRGGSTGSRGAGSRGARGATGATGGTGGHGGSAS